MKYVRTKDGEILSLNEFKYEKKYHWYSPNKKYLSRLGIDFICWNWCFDDEYDLIPEVLGKLTIKKIKKEECKFADTIEELCDWFIVEGDDNEITYHKTLFSAETDGKDYILESNETYTIYGCVLDKGKGLIYVAKMNDKGELELL